MLAAINTTELIVENKAWKKSGSYGICTHNLCDTGAVLYQLS